MDFRRLVEKYKSGEATEEERRQLEEAVERFELLSELAFEGDTLPAAGLGALQPPEEAQADSFAKHLKRELRKVYLRIGLTIGALVLAVLLFVQFGLSPLLNSLYYNPSAQAESMLNQLSLDMQVYTELVLPLRVYQNALVESTGFGSYDIQLTKSWRLADQEDERIGGRIERGELRLYNPAALTPPYQNIMGFSSAFHRDGVMAGVSPADALQEIEGLPEGEMVSAYVTFEQDLSYAQCMELETAYDLALVWYGVRTSDHSLGYGFSNTGSGFAYESPAINQQYPELLQDVNNFIRRADPGEEERQKQHFLSMVRYLGDQKNFQKMVGSPCPDKEGAEEISRYIEENGFMLYGCAVYADRETLLALAEHPNVYGICLE